MIERKEKEGKRKGKEGDETEKNGRKRKREKIHTYINLIYKLSIR